MTGKMSKMCAIGAAVIGMPTLMALDVHAAVTFRTVAKTGDATPGTEADNTFSTFSPPSINRLGQTAFVSRLINQELQDTGPSVWSEGSGSLGLIAKTGDPAPDTSSGTVFGGVGNVSFISPIINEAGETIFKAPFHRLGAPFFGNTYGIWAENSGSLNLITHQGRPAPGTDPEIIFNNIAPPVFNGNGQAAFRAKANGSSINSEKQGVWSDTTGPLTPIALEGGAAPDTEPGAVFKTQFASPLFEYISLNSAGHTAFKGYLQGPTIHSGNLTGIWSDISGSLRLLVRSGDSAPETRTRFTNFLSLAFNDAGQIAFHAVLDFSHDRGIWSGDSESLALIAIEGADAPGTEPGVMFTSFGKNGPVLNGAGKVAFTAKLIGPDVNEMNNEGLWLERQGSLTLVAREGDNAPGSVRDERFSTFSPALVFNGMGQIAFEADLLDPGSFTVFHSGLWATDPNGLLNLIVRTGDLFDINDDPLIEDLRTIRYVNLITNSGGEDGRGTSFNDAGQLAFSLHFTDGSQGVFVATIPEPASLTVLIVGTGLILGKRSTNLS